MQKRWVMSLTTVMILPLSDSRRGGARVIFKSIADKRYRKIGILGILFIKMSIVGLPSTSGNGTDVLLEAGRDGVDVAGVLHYGIAVHVAAVVFLGVYCLEIILEF